MTSISLTINNISVSVPQGSTILAAAEAAGVTIPTLCFLKELEERGACWMCIVEIKDKNRFVPACNTAAAEGMVIETENPTLSAMRRQNLERIIVEHSGDCNAPCELACPAGCNIPDFIAAIERGDNAKALEIIKEDIPLPAILGRICPAPCEEACRRHGVDEPLSICALKRYAADRDSEQAERYLPPCEPSSGKHVAIVGAGPAGLSAAWFLLRKGHKVTIFEAAPQAGGVMRYGIPRFRLPESVIESDVAPLLAMGLELRCNTRFGRDVTFDNIRTQYDALLLAAGTEEAASMGIAGEELEGVISGITFLRNVALGTQSTLGSKVIVTGGGNTAIDAARTALRLGAEHVTILYRRSRADMPANASEIGEALAEGITLREWAAPLSIHAVNGALEMQAIAMQAGELDASGRRKPVPIAGSKFTLQANTIISAIGQQLNPALAEAAALTTTRNGLAVNPDTLQSTSDASLFACGDCVTGSDTAIRAVAQGKLAAHSIHSYLTNQPVEAPTQPFNSSYGNREQAPKAFYAQKEAAPRVALPELPLSERQGNFHEVAIGYNNELARTEAARCLRCKCNAINNCRLRDLATHYLFGKVEQHPEHLGFYKAANSAISMEREKCVDCGICVRLLEEHNGNVEIAVMRQSCPTGALSMPM
uniref:Glutamate synthase (NADPH) small chain n=1 Tax=Chlorobium chlorochromatii (strain CaD3) TaxID=340177 RepID=Q3AT22_CHLCH